LVYDEQIRLMFPDQPPMEGRRQYLWHAAPAGVSVCFDDGRAFHDIALDGTAAQAAHWCDPDQYDVRYDFADWPRWRSVWDVRGPRKDYAMTTDYWPSSKS
jgi:hypothetical protein